MPLANPGVRMMPGIKTDFDAGIVGIALSDSGLRAAALGDGTVQLVHSDGDVRPVLAHEGAALCLTLDTDGLGFVTGGDDGRVVRSSPDGTVARAERGDDKTGEDRPPPRRVLHRVSRPPYGLPKREYEV